MAYYGENFCQGKFKDGRHCTNKAYYSQNNINLCGVHSDKNHRLKLENNPNGKKIKEEKITRDRCVVIENANINKINGERGKVIVTKLMMMKNVEDNEGYLKVFPNYKHKNRKDGYGCPGLSPKSLGPVYHKMPNLPVAQNLENYHQFAKCFNFELDDNKNTLPIYFENRINGYNDSEPHRHKYPLDHLKKYNNNANVPLFSIYYDDNGLERRFTYLESRYFYCKLYEKLAKQTDDYKYLLFLLNEGYNLQIVGYDGYPVSQNILTHYHDTSKPFGHELVLYTLLTTHPDNYPWDNYYNSHIDVYHNITI